MVQTARQPIITLPGRLATSAGDVYFHNVISLRHLGVDFLFVEGGFVGPDATHSGRQRSSSEGKREREREREREETERRRGWKVRGGCFAGNWCQFNPALRSTWPVLTVRVSLVDDKGGRALEFVRTHPSHAVRPRPPHVPR